jgi:hypothetical protein
LEASRKKLELAVCEALVRDIALTCIKSMELQTRRAYFSQHELGNNFWTLFKYQFLSDIS